MHAVSNPDQRAMATFAAQEGTISLRQARAAGLSDDQVVNRCARGLWCRRGRGVYVLAGSPDMPRQRAMVAFLATTDAGGMVSHLTAAAMHGLTSFPTLPHITVPPSASDDSRTARIHRGTVPPRDRTRRGGMVVTTPSRTLADCAMLVDRATLEELVDVAFCRKLATRESTLAAAARAGRRRRGAPLLRSVVEVWSPTIEPGSVAEVRLLRILEELGAGELTTQYEIVDAAGSFVGRVDVADPSIRCGLEYDGVQAHNPRVWDRNEERYARLRAAGWKIDSVSKLDLLPGEPRLRRIVERWSARRAA